MSIIHYHEIYKGAHPRIPRLRCHAFHASAAPARPSRPRSSAGRLLPREPGYSAVVRLQTSRGACASLPATRKSRNSWQSPSRMRFDVGCSMFNVRCSVSRFKTLELLPFLAFPFYFSSRTQSGRGTGLLFRTPRKRPQQHQTRI
jgi:hypothetical protein